MSSKSMRIFASFHPNDTDVTMPALERIRTAGWCNIGCLEIQAGRSSASKLIQQSEMVLVFLSKAFALDDRLMLENFAYTATVVRKPFIPIWLDSLADIQQAFQNEGADMQLLSALEMLTAKHVGTIIDDVLAALDRFVPDETLYKPSSPQVCEKPCEAYEGKEPYMFISYAHDDAIQVYPRVKELYEAGWDLWYDEGIKATERYLPVIADRIKRCSVFALMLTNRCLERPFVMSYELEYARRRGIPIIPVRLEDIDPQRCPKETAIAPDTLLERIGSIAGLANRGTRVAVPPAVKQNVVYDVVLPPKLPGFESSVQGDVISITKYIGDDLEIVIPGTAVTQNGDMAFRVLIDKNAFRFFESPVKITILDGITSIDNEIFDGCALTSIFIPKSVTSIGRRAFGNCKSLKSVTIPDSVTSIGYGAFEGCTSLANISVLCSVTTIGHHAFSGCTSLADIRIPESVVTIGSHAFSGCESLTSATIPDSVANIGDFAFSNCRSLTSITIYGTTSIGGYAFLDCPLLGTVFNVNKTVLYHYREKGNITSYRIPESVTRIGNGAFMECKSLASITIPDGVTSIGEMAFYSCSSLKSIIIPKSVTNIGIDAFRYCKSLTSITIPGGVTRIEGYTFSDCTSLQNVIIPDSVTSIAGRAFRNCSRLKSVIIPDSVTSIGDEAFKGCIMLRNVTISDNIISIGDNAFSITPVESEFKSINSFDNSVQFSESNTSEIDQTQFHSFPLPQAQEAPRALICCGEEDIQHIKPLLLELYWEGFNLYYVGVLDKQMLEKNQCVLAFFSKNASLPEQAMSILTHAVHDDVSCIIQVFLGDCTEYPSELSDEIRHKLHASGRQAIIQSRYTEQGFTGIIRDSLRRLGCSLGRPRGFDVEKKESFAEIAKFHSTDFPNVIVPKTFFTPPLPVTSIGDKAFEDSNLESITIPSSVKNIGKAAFRSCGSLTNITIPDGVTNIEEDAFLGCGLLTRVAIPSNVTSIESGVFSSCKSLVEIIVDANNPNYLSIDGVLFDKEKKTIVQYPARKAAKAYIIPSNVVSVGRRAFSGCVSLNSITIPPGVKNIGDGAFSCSSLTSLTIPDSTVNIGDGIVQGCELLASVTIPKGFPSVGWGAFSGCKSLRHVEITSNVTSIGYMAFKNCRSLRQITIPDNVTSIGEYAFENCRSLYQVTMPDCITSIGEYAFQDCESLIRVVIPRNVTNIRNSTFRNCKSLGYITIPKNVANIGDDAFYGCESLRGVTIQDGVVSIGKGAFWGCKLLDSIVIPESVTHIGRGTFIGCDHLRDVTILSKTINIDKGTFHDCEWRTIHAPPDSMAWQYAEANGLKHKPIVQ